MYHEVIKLGREVMIDQGLSDPSLSLEENPPGRGRGSSVALLVGLSDRPFPYRPAEIQSLAGAVPARRYHDQCAGYRPRFSPQHPGRPDPEDASEMGLGACRPDRHYRHLSWSKGPSGTWARPWDCRRRKSTSWPNSLTGAAPEAWKPRWRNRPISRTR